MLKLFRFTIYVLMIVMCCAKNVNVYGVHINDSDAKPVDKRQINDTKNTNSFLNSVGDEKEIQNVKEIKNNENGIPLLKTKNASTEIRKIEKSENLTINETNKVADNDLKHNSIINGIKNVTNSSMSGNSTASTEENHGTKNHVKEHNGALKRGFYVFLGLSVLVMVYLSFKAFRVRPGASPPATVRKYGIVGRRSDMELLPLPLNEEEDDDTLFDVENQTNNRL